VQHRELADRPETQERGPGLCLAEIDKVRREWRSVLVQGDEHLLAERRKGMEIQSEGHQELASLRFA
jgi:hypothetical protein